MKKETLSRAPSPADRWTWECLYPAPYDVVVERAERDQDLPPGLIHAVIRQESAFMPAVVSPADAVGLMQLIPPTAEKVAKALRVDYRPGLLTSPAHNVPMGAYYLRRVLDRFGGRIALAAAAYNAGPHAVSRWLEAGESLPLDLWVAKIPYRETRQYVAKILSNHARYRFLAGGAGAVPELSLEIPKGLRAETTDY